MLIVCSSGNRKPGWRWIEHALPEGRFLLRMYDCVPQSFLERNIRRPFLPRYRAAVQAALAACSDATTVVVSHGPLMTLWTAVALKFTRTSPVHLAFAFNFTNLPTGPRLRLMQWAFRSVDRFVVPSSLERKVYSKVFGLPKDRFDVLLWGIDKPEPPAGMPPVVTDAPHGYVCAIGGEGRDYRTLFEAAENLPQVPVVCIGRPESFAGLIPPRTVRVLMNTPADVAWDVLKHARFCVVPLLHADVPCGHVTLVSAMLQGKALLVTESRGVADYVRHNDNALLVPPSNPAAMAAALLRLWTDPGLCRQLGSNGHAFAQAYATEKATVDYVLKYLDTIATR
jgi:glycosyltransferase involved in cell wall biosynthesis